MKSPLSRSLLLSLYQQSLRIPSLLSYSTLKSFLVLGSPTTRPVTLTGRSTAAQKVGTESPGESQSPQSGKGCRLPRQCPEHEQGAQVPQCHVRGPGRAAPSRTTVGESSAWDQSSGETSLPGPGPSQDVRASSVFPSQNLGSIRQRLQNLRTGVHGPYLAQNPVVPLPGENGFLSLPVYRYLLGLGEAGPLTARNGVSRLNPFTLVLCI